MTSRELANMVIRENKPCDYGWIRHVYHNQGYKGLKEMAKTTVEVFAPKGASKQLVGRATKMVVDELYGLVR